MSQSFCIVVPSNNLSVPGNTTSKFSVHLPHTLDFNGKWVCGLHKISYPRTWSALGTGETQYLDIFFTNSENIRVVVPSKNYSSPDELGKSLTENIAQKAYAYLSDLKLRKKRSFGDLDDLDNDVASPLDLSSGPPPSQPSRKRMKPEDVKTWGQLMAMDTPAGDILEALLTVKIVYLRNQARFMVTFGGELIRYVTFSAQLSYVLGFEEATKIRQKGLGKYMPDMEGGVSNLCIYSNIAENMIVGDRMASLLSVVAVTGEPKRTVEVVYDTPIFNKVLSKQLNRIDIEIRTFDNRLVPFDYGVVVLTLMFKKLLF